MSIFGEQIKRPIGAADMEFYESAIVLRMALLLSGYTDEQWDALTARTRTNWIERATTATCKLFNDSAVVARLPVLARNLQQRA